MDRVVVYGDFTCGSSFLASTQVDELLRQGADIEWRAVQRVQGHEVYGHLVSARSMRGDSGRVIPIGRKAEQASTGDGTLVDASLAIAAFAALEGVEAHTLRAALFRAHWVEHRDLNDLSLLRKLAGSTSVRFSTHAQHWQRMWEGLADPAVPAVRLTTGYVYREKEALEALARLGATPLSSLERRLSLSSR